MKPSVLKGLGFMQLDLFPFLKGYFQYFEKNKPGSVKIYASRTATKIDRAISSYESLDLKTMGSTEKTLDIKEKA